MVAHPLAMIAAQGNTIARSGTSCARMLTSLRGSRGADPGEPLAHWRSDLFRPIAGGGPVQARRHPWAHGNASKRARRTKESLDPVRPYDTAFDRGGGDDERAREVDLAGAASAGEVSVDRRDAHL